MADKKKKGFSKGKGAGKREVKEYRSFLYMLPAQISAMELSKQLDFVKKEAIEVWTAVNLLEITLDNGTLTFEDMMENLNSAEDAALLSRLHTLQVYACDYEAADAEAVQKIISKLLEAVGGFLASDTEDFKPFMQAEEL